MDKHNKYKTHANAILQIQVVQITITSPIHYHVAVLYFRLFLIDLWNLYYGGIMFLGENIAPLGHTNELRSDSESMVSLLTVLHKVAQIHDIACTYYSL